MLVLNLSFNLFPLRCCLVFFWLQNFFSETLLSFSRLKSLFMGRTVVGIQKISTERKKFRSSESYNFYVFFSANRKKASFASSNSPNIKYSKTQLPLVFNEIIIFDKFLSVSILLILIEFLVLCLLSKLF